MKLSFIYFLFFCYFVLVTPMQAETLLLRSGKVLRVKLQNITPDTIVFLNQNGKKESIHKKYVYKVLYRDQNGNEKDLFLEKEKEKLAAELKLEFEKEKKLMTEKQEEELKKEKEKTVEEEKRKHEENLKSELEKEYKLREKALEEIKDKKLINTARIESDESFTTSNFIYSPPNRVIALASSNANCSFVNDKKQWFALFGSVPINKIKSSDMFKNDGEFRVYVKVTAVDILVSTVLAFWTTVTVKTVYIESCKTEPIYILEEKEIDHLIGKKEDNNDNPPKETEEVPSIEPKQ